VETKHEAQEHTKRSGASAIPHSSQLLSLRDALPGVVDRAPARDWKEQREDGQAGVDLD
jgi:hypothetical protein